MKTSTEINREQQAADDRQNRYDRAVYQRDQCSKGIEIVNRKLSEIDDKALREMHELAAEVPADLITHGTRFQAGGFDVRELLTGVLANAINDVEARRKQLLDTRGQAERMLSQAQAVLKALES